jgi:hypothetical protein
MRNKLFRQGGTSLFTRIYLKMTDFCLRRFLCSPEESLLKDKYCQNAVVIDVSARLKTGLKKMNDCPGLKGDQSGQCVSIREIEHINHLAVQK